MSPSPSTPRTPDPLELAFCEYAIQNWGEKEWRQFGRETGTGDILADDPRLYRSLSFGDDDYDEAVYRLVPKVIHEALGTSDWPQERLQLLADFAPGLASWVMTHAAGRTRRNLLRYLQGMPETYVPSEWQELLHSSTAAKLANARQANWQPHSREAGDQWTGNPSRQEFSTSISNTATFPSAIQNAAQNEGLKSNMATSKSIFIVHGHDHTAVNAVKIFVYEVTGIMPTTLSDKAGKGNTLIEKFEREATSTTYAIVLLTPDDEGRIHEVDKNGINPHQLMPRARQNVVLELGYFFGKLGRERVAVLNAGVDQPSDVHGVQYIPYPGTEWKEDLRRELTAADLLKRY